MKFDGFRALAYVEKGECRLISRKDNTYQSFTDLRAWIGKHLKAKDAILDGEIVWLDENGRSMFNELFYRQGDAYFYAFDLLWLNGKDLREWPLRKRKARLKKLLPDRKNQHEELQRRIRTSRTGPRLQATALATRY